MFCYQALSDAWLGDIDLELVVSQGIVVEHADRLIGIHLRGHGCKREALRHASRLVFDEIHRRDGTSLREQGIDFILCGRLAQVSYINSNIHFVTAFYPKGHVSGRAGRSEEHTSELQSLAYL